MPQRNLIVIALAAAVSLVCYEKVRQSRIAWSFAEAVEKVADNYIEPVDERELFESAMQGMVRKLDPYSAYIGRSKVKLFNSELDQQFGGLGIEVMLDPKTERLMVVSPLVDTPAYHAGMRAGDLIIEVDGKSTEGVDLQEAVGLMRGKPGTKVRVSVLRQAEQEPLLLEIIRAIIKVESVRGDTRKPAGGWNYYLEQNERIGYVRITTFGEQTIHELEKALRFEEHPVDALILDLRGNPGGLLDVAVDTCNMFVDEGVIVSTRGRGGIVREIKYARPRETIVPADLPMAVLVDKGSASASEIVSACLQDHGRAIVVGVRTWGKGTVQNVIELEHGKSMLKLTTATYWRPSEKNIHRGKDAKEEDDWGVSPTKGYEVTLSDEQLIKMIEQRRQRDIVRRRLGGQVKSNGEAAAGDQQQDEPSADPQLNKAVEYLQEKLRELDM